MEPKNPSEPSFAQRVEEALLQVPPGRVVTYGGLALLAGRPRAARAVGMLMARNPYGEYCPVIGWCPPRENCPAGLSGRNRPGVCGRKE